MEFGCWSLEFGKLNTKNNKMNENEPITNNQNPNSKLIKKDDEKMKIKNNKSLPNSNNIIQKPNRGITMVSLSIYIVTFTLVIALISIITTFFYGNVLKLSDETRLVAEFDKLKIYMIEETQIKGNMISELNEANKQITFSSGNTYKIEEYGIYRNDIRIFEANMDLEGSSFYQKEENGKEIIGVNIVTNEDYSNSLEYTLELRGLNDYQVEGNYTGETMVLQADGSYNVIKGINTPKVEEGMIPIKWNGSKWVITSTDDWDWYNYKTMTVTQANGTVTESKKWANIMLSDGIYKGDTAIVGQEVADTELRKYVCLDTKICISNNK